MRPLTLALGLALGLALPPGSAHAQDESRSPPPGSYGISFNLPESGGAGFGLRRMLSETTNAGIDVLIDFDWSDFDRTGPALPDEDPRTTFRLHVRPNLRLYRRLTEEVLPFLLVGIGAAYTNSPDDNWAWGAAAELGIGVEWFPASDVSVSGSTGLRGDFTYRSNSGGNTVQQVHLGAFRSTLSLNVYF